MDLVNGFVVFVVPVASVVLAYIFGLPVLKKHQQEQSQKEFRAIRTLIKGNQRSFIEACANLYPDDWRRVSGQPLLTHVKWMPKAPLPLQNVQCVFGRPSRKREDIRRESLPKLRKMWPMGDDGRRFDAYSLAIEEFDKPGIFENRLAYRLLSITIQETEAKETVCIMKFDKGAAKYFDNFDLGESFGYGVAKWVYAHKKGEHDLSRKDICRLKDSGLVRLRTGLDPFDLEGRIVTPGVVTLTIRKGKDCSDFPTFFLLRRDDSKVATAQGQLSAVPAGEFQPSTDATVNINNDLDIWKNIMREYTEEFLGKKEAARIAPYEINYCQDEYKTLNEALADGRVRAFYLGTTIQPMSLRAEILTVCVFDPVFFDSFFAHIKTTGEEGTIITGRRGSTEGQRFDKDAVDGIIRQSSQSGVVPSAVACLELAWYHATSLGIVLESKSQAFLD